MNNDLEHPFYQKPEFAYEDTPQPAHTEQVIPEWTNEQCLEFLQVAFRHNTIDGEIEFDDIRLGVKFALAAAPKPDGALINEDTKSDGWIKCSDRMPECSKWDHAAVIASEGSNSFVAYYNKHECKFLDEPFGESLGNKITHWMPLPRPPVAAPKPESE